MALVLKNKRRSDSPKASRARKVPWARRSQGKSRTFGRTGKAINHACGHSQKHALSGPQWKRDRHLTYLAEQPCTICWGTAKAEEVEAICGIRDLPPLVGTERQVVWARSLRALRLAGLTGFAEKMDRLRVQDGLSPQAETFLALALPPALAKTKAKWWIDQRDNPAALDELLEWDAVQVIQAMRRDTEERAESHLKESFARVAASLALPGNGTDEIVCPF